MSDTTNDQMIGVRGEEIVILRPKHGMTKREALVHAAWIVALADQSDEFTDFRAILKEVINT